MLGEVTERVTVPAKLLRLVRSIVDEADESGLAARFDGVAVIEKSGGGNETETIVECVIV